MTQKLAVSKELISMAAVQERFSFDYTTSDRFFTEWFENLPALDDGEQKKLADLQNRFYEHRNRRALPEGTVDRLILSPLLDLAGLYDAKFTIRTEALVEILLGERDELIQGRIDTLILQEQFWLLVLEAKNTTLALSVAIPQALTYMLANPDIDRPVFGLVTNGDDFRYIKLLKSSLANPIFDLSDIFCLLPPQRSKIHQILQILKQISILIQSDYHE
jgi:hypothetical protein